MKSRRSWLTVLAVLIAAVVAFSPALEGKKNKRPKAPPLSTVELDPLRMLKLFHDKNSRVGPNVVLAVDTSVRMQFDENGTYYDLREWLRTDDPAVANELGVTVGNTNYRRMYHDLAEPANFTASSIGVLSDTDPDYDTFFDVTRLGIARDGLAQAVEENQAIVRFGLVQSRYGAGAALPATGNEDPVTLTTLPQAAFQGDLTGGNWRLSVARTATNNIDVAASGNEVIVEADANDSSATVLSTLQLKPDEAGGLLPAGTALDALTDSPIAQLLTDTRAEVVRLMAADEAKFADCRNTVVVLVVGGTGGNLDPAAVAATFAAVTSNVTHRVPIYVIGLSPPAAEVADLQAIATNSGGMYFPAVNGDDVAFAANYAVQAAHALAANLDAGVSSIFQTTSPIVGTVDLTNASDIFGAALPNTAVIGTSGGPLTQSANLVVTAGFSLPGFGADLRGFRVYKPVADAMQPTGYKFVKDGTPLWLGHTPVTATRNVYTFIPGSGMVPVVDDAATAALLREYLQADTDADASDIISFVRTQPLGAIVDSTPAIMNPPSLDPAPDTDYENFATPRTTRRSTLFYGGNDGMVHAIDARTGVEVWAFIPFNLLPKLQTLLDGQPVDDFAYFVDSSPKIADVKIGNAWRTYMFIGQGPGGTFYQTFDVSDAGLGPGTTTDSEAAIVGAFANSSVIPFIWSFPQYANFDHTLSTDVTPHGDLKTSASYLEKTVGQTWSDPAVGQIDDANGPTVLITGSGFLGATVEAQSNRGGVRAGSTFYLLDIANGSVQDSYDVGDDTGKNNLKNALQADPSATGPLDTRFVNMAYIPDTEGSLWRFRISDVDGVATLSLPVKTYDAKKEHPIFSSLALVNVGGDTQYVFMSTGIDILPATKKIEKFVLAGVKDDTSKNKAGDKEFEFKLEKADSKGGDERPTTSPAVAGDVVFFTTTTEFPDDPCVCPEGALYALTYQGGAAYGAGTGGKKGKKKDTIEPVVEMDGRATAVFVADQHIYFGTGEDLQVFGDDEDFNNGVSKQGVRITSWREIR